MNTNIKKICFSLLMMQCTLFTLSALDDDDDSAFALASLNKDDETDNQEVQDTENASSAAGEQRISEKSYAKIKAIREVLVKLLGSSRFTTAKDLSERYSDSQNSMQSLKETMIHEGDFIENNAESTDYSSIKKDDMKKLIATAVQETLMNNARPVQATVNTSSQPNTSPSFITPLFTSFQQPMNQNNMQAQPNMNPMQPMNTFIQQPMNQMQQPMDQYNMYPGNNFSMQQPQQNSNLYPMNNTQVQQAPQQTFMQTAQPFPATAPTQNLPVVPTINPPTPQPIQTPQTPIPPATPAPNISAPAPNTITPTTVPTVNPPTTPAQPAGAQAVPLPQDVQYSDEGFPMDVPLDQIDAFLQQNDQENPPQP